MTNSFPYSRKSKRSQYRVQSDPLASCASLSFHTALFDLTSVACNRSIFGMPSYWISRSTGHSTTSIHLAFCQLSSPPFPSSLLELLRVMNYRIFPSMLIIWCRQIFVATMLFCESWAIRSDPSPVGRNQPPFFVCCKI